MRTIPTTLLCLLALASNAQDAITLSFVDGNKYLGMSESDRMVWVVGVMDGLMAEDAIMSKNPKGPWLGRCIKGIPPSQVKAIFEKQLREKPNSWHAPAAFVFRDSMQIFCKDRV